jgi:hypothetical protein
VIYAPDDTVTAISVFNTVAEAEESNKRALAWIEENLGPIVVGHATATAGPVIVHSLPRFAPFRAKYVRLILHSEGRFRVTCPKAT